MIIKYNEGNYELNEAYRSIRTFISIDEKLKTILVTSTEMDEGKSTSVANIARCFAELKDKKVIVIDCDFRKKSLNEQFNISSGSPGLSNIIYNEKTLDECIKNEENLHILPCGTVNCNSSVLLEFGRTKDLINSLRNKYDYIFIDSPPVLRVNDACIIAKYIDGTLVVCGSKEVDKKQIKEAKNRLEKVNANLIGVVLNKFQYKGNKIYSYYGDGEEQNRKKNIFKIKK